MQQINEKTLIALEFPKIKEMLAHETVSTLGKEKVEELEPYCSLEEVELKLKETDAAKEIISIHGDVPFGGLHDIRGALRRAGLGSILQVDELIAILNVLVSARQVHKFLVDKERLGPLKPLIEKLSFFPKLEKEINGAITQQGEIADSASPSLAGIRRQIRTAQARIQEKLHTILHSGEYGKYLQEALITLREDRYVVPVKVEYKNQFPGIIHDQSASGATVYIEPMAVVEANNQIKHLHLQEKQEIQKILSDLSNRVGQDATNILETVETLGELDFIFAKARLSRKMNAHSPGLNQKGYINIVRGRHPLLGENAIPIDVYLGKDFRALVITGPNTGGKTVTLKTIGLFTLMAQAGLHLPVDRNSEISVFDKVFCDIGDEQSIEQNLSTFSAHMQNIVGILEQVGERTLVLLDELGAGTDPTEGAALAMAILEFLYERGAHTAATTHYSELKTFAYTRPGVENACMEFDVTTLRPTYRLFMGIPGKSNAFEIAKRLGLSEDVVNKARKYLTQEDLKVEELIEGMERTQSLLEKERQELQARLQEAGRLKGELQEQKEKLRKSENRLKDKASTEAYEIVRRAEREAKAMLSSLKEKIEKEEQKNLQSLQQEMRQQLRRIKQGMIVKKEEQFEEAHGPGLEKAKPGDSVYVVSLNQKGSVVQALDNDEVVVQVGIMRVTVNLKDLRRADEKPEKEQERLSRKIGMEKAKNLSVELDLRGLLVDEALETVNKYLDDAYLANLPKVYLIHGKGTGALRSAIREMLQGHPLVGSFQPGSYNEGGEGVTVVRFKA